jgi:hypothetical protein
MVEKLKRLGWECCIWQKIVNITIGFRDADLSTNFDDFHELVQYQILNIK